jgi:hypothetical protein
MKWWRAMILIALLAPAGALADMYPVGQPVQRPGGVRKPARNRNSVPMQTSAGLAATGAAQVGVVLRNLLANPGEIDQLFSDLFYSAVRGPTWPMLTGGLVRQIDITYSGQWRVASGPAAARWRLGHTSRPAEIPLLGSPGAGGWNSDTTPGSVGKGPLNPFLSGPAVFNLDLTGARGRPRIAR